MKKILPKMKYFASFEDASILRKFFVLFFVAAIVPLLVIANMFVMSQGEEEVIISRYDLGFTLLFATLGIAAAFIGMRSSLKKIILINVKHGSKSKAEQNEIEGLTKAFDVLQK